MPTLAHPAGLTLLLSLSLLLAGTANSLCGQTGPELRRPISPTRPLIIPNTNIRVLASVADAWNAIPADLRPFCALNGDASARIPSEAEVDAWILECQRIGAPCILQAQQCNMSIFDRDGAIGDRLLKKYPNFLGYQWCEFQWAPVTFPFDNVPVWKAHLQAMVNNGGLLLMADMGGQGIWNSIGSNADVVSTMRQYKDNVVVMDKTTENGNFYWNESVVQGFWLAGITANWGVSTDGWIWETGTHQGTAATHPAAIHGMLVEKSACAGASVFMKFEKATNAQLAAVAYPLLRQIIQGNMIPSLAEAQQRIKAGHKFAGTFDQNKLCGSLYGSNSWMPQTGRYFIVPVFPQKAANADLGFCELVGLNQFSGPSDMHAFYDARYPDDGTTGSSWVTRFTARGSLMFANPNDTNQSSRDSTFSVPLLRNSCRSLAGTIHSYTYGTVEESPNAVSILVGNHMGASTLPRSNVTTFMLQGLNETQEPALTIAGHISYTKNWDPATQLYTLAVTHNGTATITLATSGRAKPGDANGDGVVDAADLAIVTAQFGRSGAEVGDARADLDGNGRVEAADLGLVTRNQGR